MLPLCAPAARWTESVVVGWFSSFAVPAGRGTEERKVFLPGEVRRPEVKQGRERDAVVAPETASLQALPRAYFGALFPELRSNREIQAEQMAWGVFRSPAGVVLVVVWRGTRMAFPWEVIAPKRLSPGLVAGRDPVSVFSYIEVRRKTWS